ncbi:MAG: spore photoproduct lyase family protein [Thermodesulfobacteriota bacterium]
MGQSTKPMRITTLYIDPAAADYPETAVVKDRVGADKVAVASPREVFAAVAAAGDVVAAGKQTLFLTVNKAPFIRKCPGTKHYRCCGYRILNIGRFCTMDCSYCILQAYFHPPLLQYYVNQADMTAELKDLFDRPGRITRLGTGEFTDSAIWNECTDLNRRLVSLFAGQDAAVLEIKTKTVNIEPLRGADHNRKTIAAWSLNTEAVISGQERGSASLEDRLRAAAACQAMGYPLAFHFDPLVIYDGCREDYAQVIRRLFSAVSADNIVWISLGSFRFMPALKPMIQERFPESRIVYGEFITGIDRKVRYFKPLRVDLYRSVISEIRRFSTDVTVYFCMEDDDVWRQCLGFTPRQKGGLAAMLDRSAVEHCGLDRDRV